MKNPMSRELQSSRLNPIKHTFQMLKNIKNPMQMIGTMASQNPNMRQVQKLIEENGGNAEAAFFKLCNEKNVDPEEILSILR